MSSMVKRGDVERGGPRSIEALPLSHPATPG